MVVRELIKVIPDATTPMVTLLQIGLQIIRAVLIQITKAEKSELILLMIPDNLVVPMKHLQELMNERILMTADLNKRLHP
jgi:hypothetical protein